MNINYKSLFNKLIAATAGAIIISACADEGPSVPGTSGNPVKGVFILYEGSSLRTDYAYYDAVSKNITNDVFRTSNSGQTLGFIPGDMHIRINSELYITCRGNTANNGGIYKINASTNLLINSHPLVNNPYGFVINANDIIIANIGSNYATRLDLSFNLVHDSIITGPMPSDLIYGFNKYLACKSALSPEQSLAYINEINNSVTKIFFDFTPVSAAFNYYGYFISSHTRKTIYRLDPEDFHKIDSIYLPTQFGFIGNIIKKSLTDFYVIAGNREIWELKMENNGMMSASIKIAQDNGITISDAAYDDINNELYIADINDGLLNGEMHIFDASNGMLKSSIPLGGRNPVRIAFLY